jgi:2-polyprenyl-3-methyl-5-hydroxy-6-metoxy-1,4-benzoquinol methylase
MPDSSKLQPKEEIEQFYETPDPWGYKTREDDAIRKALIIGAIPVDDYESVLDIGCGEGFITETLPGEKVLGIDISEKAIERTKPTPRIRYIAGDINEMHLSPRSVDLVIATGALYPHYVTKETIDKIIKATNKYLVTCHIETVGKVEIPLEPIKRGFFKYNGMVEELCVYDLRTNLIL